MFREHVRRLNAQYDQIRHRKETLPEHHIVLQMDSSENYSCSSADEIQSGYWNKTQVTLHPIVAYFKHDGKAQHKSFVVVSDEVGHNTNTVIAIITKIVPEINALDEEVSHIHYVTDRPTSQYRNKIMFLIAKQHTQLFGFPALWQYLEAGHGKGPCDGVGDCAKRMADVAVKSGQYVIQDAAVLQMGFVMHKK